MPRARRLPSGGAVSRLFGSSMAGPDAKAVSVTLLAVVVMMLFGGGIPGLVTTVLFAATGLLLLGFLAMRPDSGIFAELPLPARIGIIAIAILPLLQVLPLPPTIWHGLPGQELRLQTLTLAGLADSWQPLSVVPVLSAGTAAIAVTFVALLLMLLALPARGIPTVAWVVLGIMILNVAIGLVQVASGGQALRLHRAADHGALLGFFANKNHAAVALAVSLPVAAYALGTRTHFRGARTWLALYAMIILVAIVTANSRAGLGLGALAALLLAVLYVRSTRPAYVIGALALILIAGVLVSTTSAFEQVFGRFNIVDQDLRWQFLRTSRPLIGQYWSVGSGLGSFSTLYAVHEDLAWVKPTYVNQLHNDYFQLVLEAGIPGVLILAALVVGCGWRAWTIWSTGSREQRLPLVCGAIMLLVFALHSVADYPLRRPAALPLLALGLTLLLRGDLTASTGLRRGKQRA